MKKAIIQNMIVVRTEGGLGLALSRLGMLFIAELYQSHEAAWNAGCSARVELGSLDEYGDTPRFHSATTKNGLVSTLHFGPCEFFIASRDALKVLEWLIAMLTMIEQLRQGRKEDELPHFFYSVRHPDDATTHENAG